MTRYRKSWTQVIEEVQLYEALKPIDKSVVDAFYYKKEKAGKVVSTDGDSLWKNGLGGQEIAIWTGRKIKITAVSDVKSTESIIKYIRKSIPSGILEEVEEGVTGPTRMEVQKHFDKEKGLLRARINATEKALKISDMKVDAKGTVQSFKEEVVTIGDQLDQIVKEAELDERNKGGSITIGYGKNALKDAGNVNYTPPKGK